ncbi:MAG: chloride channel protein, partial [Betaproteobacteria bacterium]
MPRIREGTHELPASYALLKFAATMISYLSGIPAGIFAPSPTVGAGMGSNVAKLAPYVPAGADCFKERKSRARREILMW